MRYTTFIRAIFVLLFTLFYSALLMPHTTGAQEGVITVDDECTLVDAITAANTDEAVGGCPAGDGDDVIELTADVLLTEINHEADGDNGLPSVASVVTIEGNGFAVERNADAPQFRIFRVDSSGDLTLNNVTVSGGVESEGGGALNYGTMTITDSTFSGNTVGYGGGGGISNSGTLTVSNSTLSDNGASSIGMGGGISNSGTLIITNSTLSGNWGSFGGGICNEDGTVTITDSTLSGNHAGVGGGVSNDGTMDVVGSTFDGNRGRMGGGGISNGGDGVVTVTDSIFSNNSVYESGGSGGGIRNVGAVTIAGSMFTGNSVSDNGGGVINFGGTVDITDSMFTDNSADGNGGGIVNSSDGVAAITASTLSGNSTDGDGGAILNNGAVTITNSTLSGNAAGEFGGGIANGGMVTITGSTLFGNSAFYGGGIINGSDGVTDITNSIVANSSVMDCSGGCTGSNNLDSGGSCPDSQIITGLDDELADNGGSTMTHALLEGSNAIDAGDPEFCPETDQRGAARVGPCDIGAFEFGGVVPDAE